MLRRKISLFVLGLSLSGVTFATAGGGGSKAAEVAAGDITCSVQEEVPVNRNFSKPLEGDYARWEELVKIIESSVSERAEKSREILSTMQGPRDVLKAIETIEHRCLLHEAAALGDLELVKVLVSFGADIYALRQKVSYREKTAKKKNPNKPKRDSAFLSKSDNGYKGTIRGETALHAALESTEDQADAVAEFLVKQDCKGDTFWVREGSDRNLPIHLAARHGRPLALMAMLMRDRSLVDELNRNEHDARRETPLFIATRGLPSEAKLSSQHIECVRLLVNAGANLQYSYTIPNPLKQGEELVESAICESKGLNQEDISRFVEIRDKSHQKLLDGIKEQDQQKWQEALNEGAAFDGIYYKDGKIQLPLVPTPLHIAVQVNNFGFIKYLSDEGLLRIRDLERLDNKGLTPFHYMKRTRDFFPVHKLFIQARYPHLDTRESNSCLEAIENGDYRFLDFYSRYYSEVFNYVLAHGDNLHKAIEIYSKKIREYNAQVANQGNAEDLALSKQSMKNSRKIVDRLLDLFYSKNALELNKRASGEGHQDTALHLACRLAIPSLVKKLMRVKGIDPEVVNGDLDTLLHVAMRGESESHLKIVVYLVNVLGREIIQAESDHKESPWKEIQKEPTGDDESLEIRSIMKFGRTKWGNTKKYEALMEQFRNRYKGFLN